MGRKQTLERRLVHQDHVAHAHLLVEEVAAVRLVGAGRGTSVMVRVWCGASSISPSGAPPARIRALAKNLAAVKSWPLPERLTKVSVTGGRRARWSGVGAKLKF